MLPIAIETDFLIICSNSLNQKFSYQVKQKIYKNLKYHIIFQLKTNLFVVLSFFNICGKSKKGNQGLCRYPDQSLTLINDFTEETKAKSCAAVSSLYHWGAGPANTYFTKFDSNLKLHQSPKSPLLTHWDTALLKATNVLSHRAEPCVTIYEAEASLMGNF